MGSFCDVLSILLLTLGNTRAETALHGQEEQGLHAERNEAQRQTFFSETPSSLLRGEIEISSRSVPSNVEIGSFDGLLGRGVSLPFSKDASNCTRCKRCAGTTRHNSGATYKIWINQDGYYTVKVQWGSSDRSAQSWASWREHTFVQWDKHPSAEDNILAVGVSDRNSENESSSAWLVKGEHELNLGNGFDTGAWTLPWCAITIEGAKRVDSAYYDAGLNRSYLLAQDALDVGVFEDTYGAGVQIPFAKSVAACPTCWKCAGALSTGAGAMYKVEVVSDGLYTANVQWGDVNGGVTQVARTFVQWDGRPDRSASHLVAGLDSANKVTSTDVHFLAQGTHLLYIGGVDDTSTAKQRTLMPWCDRITITGPIPMAAPTSSPTRTPTTADPTEAPTDSPTLATTKSPTSLPTPGTPTPSPTPEPTFPPTLSLVAVPEAKLSLSSIDEDFLPDIRLVRYQGGADRPIKSNIVLLTCLTIGVGLLAA